MHTTMVPEQVKTMKIQAGIQVSRPRELTRQLQLWKRFGRLYLIVFVLVRNISYGFTLSLFNFDLLSCSRVKVSSLSGTNLFAGSDVSYRISYKHGFSDWAFLRYKGFAKVGLPLYVEPLGAMVTDIAQKDKNEAKREHGNGKSTRNRSRRRATLAIPSNAIGGFEVEGNQGLKLIDQELVMIGWS
ncbi:hypothetical protein Tco_0273209 [Tanacetum coccineum]